MAPVNATKILLVLLLAEISSADNYTTDATLNEEDTRGDEFLDHLAAQDALAYRIWNFTNKYNIMNYTHLDQNCLSLDKGSRIDSLSPYLINVTLNDTADFLYFYFTDEFLYKDWHKLQRAHKLLEELQELLEDEVVYYTAVQDTLEHLGYDDDTIFVCGNSHCDCIWMSNVEIYERRRTYIHGTENSIKEFIVFGYYVDPPLRILTILTGLVFSVGLLVIFVREKSMRTEANVIICNLLVNNLIVLIAYLPMQYFYKFYPYSPYLDSAFLILETTVVSVNCMVVMMLNLQRCCDVSRLLNPNVEGCRLRPLWRCLMYTATIWCWSVGVSTLISTCDDYVRIELQVTLYVFIYLFVFTIILAVVNAVTARKLQKAALQGQVTAELQDLTGAGVILSLTVAFYLVHIPAVIFIPMSHAEGRRGRQYFFSLSYRITSEMVHLLFCNYPSVSVFLLYKFSSSFRRAFRKYLCRCWFSPEDEQYVTMSSLQNNENC